MARSAGVLFAHQSSRHELEFVSDTSYHWLRSGDRLANARDLRSVMKVIWNFGGITQHRRSLIYGISCSNHLDLVTGKNSHSAWATQLSFTVYEF